MGWVVMEGDGYGEVLRDVDRYIEILLDVDQLERCKDRERCR